MHQQLINKQNRAICVLLNFVDGIENKSKQKSKMVFGETFGGKTKFTYRWVSLFQRKALLFASKSKLNQYNVNQNSIEEA